MLQMNQRKRRELTHAKEQLKCALVRSCVHLKPSLAHACTQQQQHVGEQTVGRTYHICSICGNLHLPFVAAANVQHPLHRTIIIIYVAFFAISLTFRQTLGGCLVVACAFRNGKIT